MLSKSGLQLPFILPDLLLPLTDLLLLLSFNNSFTPKEEEHTLLLFLKISLNSLCVTINLILTPEYSLLDEAFDGRFTSSASSTCTSRSFGCTTTLSFLTMQFPIMDEREQSK
ncbi:hypothetical protein LguiA_022711 [Lonicera macranthoides]